MTGHIKHPRFAFIPRGLAGKGLTSATTGAVPVLRQAQALDVAEVRFVRPDIARAISGIRAPTGGAPRAEITCPISPVADVTDQVLFEQPGDPDKKSYLPRYRIAEQNRQYRISLEQGPQVWNLIIHLEKYPAPEIQEQARLAGEIDHAVSVILTYRLRIGDSGGGLKEMAFQEVTPEAGGKRAVLRVNNLAERDEVYQAMTDAGRGAALIIRRAVTVAIPMNLPTQPTITAVSSGMGVYLRGTYTFDFDAGVEGPPTGADVHWRQHTHTVRTMDPIGQAQIVNIGQVDYDQIMPEQLKGLTYSGEPIKASTSDDPGAILLATSHYGQGGTYGAYNTNQTGVWYDTSRAKWTVFNEGGAAMPEAADFNIHVARPGETAFVHKSDASNTVAHATYIDHPMANGSGKFRIFVTQQLSPQGAPEVHNPHHIGVWYDANRKQWAIFNQDLHPMPHGVHFNVYVAAGDEAAFVHKADVLNTGMENTGMAHATYIDHPMANGDSQAMLQVTPSLWNNIYNNHAVGVWYEAGRQRWTIFNHDLKPIHYGTGFNVRITKMSDWDFLHRSGSYNIAGHCTYLDLPELSRNSLVNGDVFAVRTDGGNYAKVQVLTYDYDLLIRWDTYQFGAYSEIPLFREVTRAVDVTINPFVFPLDLYGYIYRGVTGVGGDGSNPIRRQVRWGNIFKSYYQDQAQLHRFYYLPDKFKIVRRPESPHYPIMAIRFPRVGEEVTNMQVTLDYWAFPYVDPRRLEDAEAKLRGFVTAPLPPGVTGPVFEPLLPEKAKLFITLPRSDGATGNQERADVLIDLRAGFHDSLTMTMEDFRGIFEAMFGDSSVLFQGQVEVDLGGGPKEVIPFTARMDDMAGEVFDYREAQDSASGGVRATLRNAIESPVRIRSLSAEIDTGDSRVPARVAAVNANLPLELQPREEATFDVVPATPAGGTPRAVFDLSGVEVLPDQQAIYNAILRASPAAGYSRAIEVETFAEIFEPPEGRPGDRIQAIVVDFERGDSVRLAPGNLTAHASVRLPISDYILRSEGQGFYRYRINVIRLGGQQDRDEDWRTDSTGHLYPDVRR